MQAANGAQYALALRSASSTYIAIPPIIVLDIEQVRELTNSLIN
jgi:hypothetical protein